MRLLGRNDGFSFISNPISKRRGRFLVSGAQIASASRRHRIRGLQPLHSHRVNLSISRTLRAQHTQKMVK